MVIRSRFFRCNFIQRFLASLQRRQVMRQSKSGEKVKTASFWSNNLDKRVLRVNRGQGSRNLCLKIITQPNQAAKSTVKR